jgi:hypothetical protein
MVSCGTRPKPAVSDQAFEQDDVDGVAGCTLPCSSCSTTMQFASDIERKMPEPCAPVMRTSGMPSRRATGSPRWYSVRPGLLADRGGRACLHQGSGASAPIMRSRASRAKK